MPWQVSWSWVKPTRSHWFDKDHLNWSLLATHLSSQRKECFYLTWQPGYQGHLQSFVTFIWPCYRSSALLGSNKHNFSIRCCLIAVAQNGMEVRTSAAWNFSDDDDDDCDNNGDDDGVNDNVMTQVNDQAHANGWFLLRAVWVRWQVQPSAPHRPRASTTVCCHDTQSRFVYRSLGH